MIIDNNIVWFGFISVFFNHRPSTVACNFVFIITKQLRQSKIKNTWQLAEKIIVNRMSNNYINYFNITTA